MWSLRTLADELGLSPEYYGWSWVIAMALIAIWAFSASGLVFVWTGLSRRHWFMRLAGAAGVVAMAWLLPGVRPHRAWDLAAVFLVQGAIVVGVIGLVRGVKWAWNAWRTAGWRALVPMRFGLRDLLLLFIVVGAGLAAFRQIPEEYLDFEWPVMVGTAVGLCTLLQTWTALGTQLAWLRVLVALVQLPALVAIWLGSSRRAGVFLEVNSRERPEEQERTAKRRASWTLGVITFAIFAPVISLWLRLAFPPRVVLPPVPTPNGYDELLRIGVGISEQDILRRQFRAMQGDAPVLTPDDWREFLTEAKEAMRRSEAAIEQESVTPIDRARELDPLPELFLSREGRVRNVIRLFEFAAKGSAAIGDAPSASRWNKNLLRLADRGAYGGLWDDYVSVAYLSQQLAARHAFDLRNQLSVQDARDLAQFMSNTEPREHVEQIIDRILAWEEREQGWMGGLRAVVAQPLPNGHHSARLLRSVNARALARQRLASTELALAAFRTEEGRFPHRLEELVPEYLPGLPYDPFSGQPIVYRPQDDNYLLYSFGEDRDDDGGRPVDPNARYHESPDGDMLFDHALRDAP